MHIVNWNMIRWILFRYFWLVFYILSYVRLSLCLIMRILEQLNWKVKLKYWNSWVRFIWKFKKKVEIWEYSSWLIRLKINCMSRHVLVIGRLMQQYKSRTLINYFLIKLHRKNRSINSNNSLKFNMKDWFNPQQIFNLWTQIQTCKSKEAHYHLIHNLRKKK